MTSAEIQSFLSAKVPVCHSTYTCLMGYAQTTPAMAASSGACTAIPAGPSRGLSAADIIEEIGVACGISEKVILVLLQKEQGLVTSSTPSASSFAFATGYNCPDSTGCDPAYGGFFYQVYYAARQFKFYRANPTHFNFQAGRANAILFSPNASCGSGSVVIQNQATAGLYDYTPYQPNAAALANLTGSGDSCSSYGNRNFWVYYNAWFGSPTIGTSLLRTAADSTVYLVSGTVKSPISDVAIYNALFPLGQVATVSQSVLDGYTASHPVGRSLRGPDGSIYFFDAGIILGFTSCAQAVDYGASCDSTGYTQLTAGQISAFTMGPNVTPVLGTVEGGRYWITGGTKREILDSTSQALASLPASMNVLTENAVAVLPYGQPVTRDSVFAQTRGSSSYSYLQGAVKYPVVGDPTQIGAVKNAVGALSAASIALITASGSSFTGVVTSPSQPDAQILTSTGRFDWPVGIAGYTGAGSLPTTQSLVDSYPLLGTIGVGTFIKTASNATIYVATASQLKPVGSWTALLSLSPTPTPTILTVPDSAVAATTPGLIAMSAGSLVRSPDNATIYFINGLTNKIPVSNFDMTNAAGVTGFQYFSDALIAGYPTSSTNLAFGYTCGATDYVAANGSIHPIAAANVPLYPITYLPLDSFACAQMKIGSAATTFIRTPEGSIYQLAGGLKHAITSLSRYYQLDSTSSGFLNVAPEFAALIPTGANA